ncbi:MAG: hypothetical protein LLG16_00045 [Euryarchaeota archaeon]|nr:hypothetical protein [Euryarchaeota archaeon]
MGKCIVCGSPTKPSEVICDKCDRSQNGFDYFKLNPSTVSKIKGMAIFKKGENIERAFIGSTPGQRAPLAAGEGMMIALASSLTLYMMVTNERILIVEESGLIRRNFDLFEAIELEDVRGTSIKEMFLAEAFKINFQTRGGLGDVEISNMMDMDKDTFDVNGPTDLEMLRQWMDARVQDKIRLVEERSRRDKVQIMLDFDSLRDEMAKGGIVMKAIKCPNCNAAVDMPEAGCRVECQYCGSSIVAQDIFDKMKGLIGN